MPPDVRLIRGMELLTECNEIALENHCDVQK